jgi:magnesium transporter
VRQHVVLINVDPIRLVLLRDRFLLFLPEAEGADQISTLLLDAFASVSPVGGSESDFSFELQALEAVFETIVQLLQQEYVLLEPDVLASLKKLRASSSGLQSCLMHHLFSLTPGAHEMDELRLLKNGVSAFDSKVEAIHGAISRILDSDVDLASLNLTWLWENPDTPLTETVHEDGEILLETYQQEINHFRRNLTMLMRQIENTQELVNIRLDTSRNRLLTFDTLVSTMSLSFGIMTACSGYFGLPGRSLVWIGLIVTRNEPCQRQGERALLLERCHLR